MAKKGTAQKKTQEPEPEGGLHQRKEYADHQTLLCDMTDAEVLATSRMASDLKIQLDDAIANAKSNAKEHKDTIKSIQGRFDELMKKVDTGQEHRDVKVLVIYDYEDGLYIAARQDTGEEIARRPLRENERQQEIPGTSTDESSSDSDSGPDDSPDDTGSGE